MKIRHCIFLSLMVCFSAVRIATAQSKKDSIVEKNKTSHFFLVLPTPAQVQNEMVQIGWDSILAPFDADFSISKKNKIEKISDPYPAIERNIISKDFVFYFILFLCLFLGILNMAFKNYFNTMIRVFFKTSLRQSQLADQLMQAKLPSLFLNVFSVLAIGFYIFALMNYRKIIGYSQLDILLNFCFAVFILFVGKFFIVQAAGWISGFKQEAVSYTFIIFLVYKLLAIILLPLTCIFVFSNNDIGLIAYRCSISSVVIFYFFRCFRTYSIFKNKFSLSKFHFLVYILAIEFIPILLLYKIGFNIIDKNL